MENRQDKKVKQASDAAEVPPPGKKVAFKGHIMYNFARMRVFR